MSRSLKDYVFLGLKGMAMGAADVVPGVSGGTIAFISGIYEEFIESLKSINLSALEALRKKGLKGFWKHVNGNFLLVLFLGIGISIASLAKLITYLLKEHEVSLWAFFFGLIVASIFLVGKTVKKWVPMNIGGLLAGAAISFWITTLQGVGGTEALWYIFLSGLIAICAMILPGISGSFILLLLGSYQVVLGAVKNMDVTIIAVFGAGAVTGLISFSKLLSYLFKRFHDLIIAILTGFLVGSLNKVWPWKSISEFRINSHGEKVPFIQENILPGDFSTVNDVEMSMGIFVKDANVMLAIVLAILGFGLIYGLEWAAKRISEPQTES